MGLLADGGNDVSGEGMDVAGLVGGAPGGLRALAVVYPRGRVMAEEVAHGGNRPWIMDGQWAEEGSTTGGEEEAHRRRGTQPRWVMIRG